MARKSNLPKDKNGKIKPGPGKPRGSANKSTRQIIDMILKVATELQRSPATSLKAVAVKDTKWFYQHVLRMALPKNIEVKTEGEQRHKHDLGPETQQLLEKLYKKHK